MPAETVDLNVYRHVLFVVGHPGQELANWARFLLQLHQFYRVVTDT